MKRRIIKIDENKCNGCSLCATACHEGAIGMVNGKAKLLRDDYCDGFGDCLPACPTGAISFEEREALPYDEQAVEKAKAQRANASLSEPKTNNPTLKPLPCGCPGSASQSFAPRGMASLKPVAKTGTMGESAYFSELRQWPVQIKLVPENAPYFANAHLLIAADCSAFACGNFHQKFMRGKVTLIGCPKLDGVNYAEKLKAIIAQNSIKSVTCIRMEVPCCGGLETATKDALMQSGKFIPWQVVTLSRQGEVVEE